MEITTIQKPTSKELTTIVWSDKYDAIFAMGEQAKHEKCNKYLKAVTYGNNGVEYAIVNTNEVIDASAKCYVASCLNGMLTVK
jgi:hypothetical protein